MSRTNPTIRDTRRLPGKVVVINDASVAFGGATSLALLSARAMVERGVAVCFLAGDEGKNLALAEAGVRVFALGGARLLSASALASLSNGIYRSATQDLVKRLINDMDSPDTIYHLHTWTQILSPSIFAALEPVRDRLFISAHDFFLVCPNGAYALYRQGLTCPYIPLGPACLITNCDRRSYGHKLWRVARQAVQARTLRYRDGHPHVLAIHPAMRPFLLRGGVPNDAITTLPNPITPWSTTRIAAEQNREFVFVGRLNDEKGPDLAARAARIAGVPLHVIGDGPLFPALKRDYPEVRFSGRQPPLTVASLVKKARALVIPSRYPEPYGLVIGEALWSGLPVILTEQALLARDVVEREAGIACDPRDEVALAQAMARLAQEDVLVERMSLNAFTRTADLGHTTEGWIDALLEAYSAAL